MDREEVLWALEKALDGKTLPGECAFAIVEAQNADRSKAAEAVNAGPDPVPVAPEPPEAQAKPEDTPEAVQAELREYMKTQAAKGRQITSLQAATELRALKGR